MSLFFKEGSQVSDYQNTAFFQNGEASKASIFDDPIKSETQMAFELFNIDSVDPGDNRDQSIVSRLDLLERNREEYSQREPEPEVKPQSKRDIIIESQESRESRMTFGAKLQSNFRKSKAEECPKAFYQQKKQASKPKVLLAPRPKANQPSSNFSLPRSMNSTKQPESMPVKFQDYKPPAPSKVAFQGPSNSSSSSFSIDFDEIRQRNQIQAKPIVNKQVTSLKLNNLNEKQVKDYKSQSGNSDKISEKSTNEYRLNTKDNEKQKKFGFNLRRSKVSQENKDNKLSTGFLSKANNNTYGSLTSITASHSPINHLIEPKIEPPTKNEEKSLPLDQSVVTPFKMRPKQMVKEVPVEKTIITSNVKRVEPERKSLFGRISTEIQSTSKQKNLNPQKDLRKTIQIKAAKEDKIIEQPATIEKQPSEKAESTKRQSIGLREQLKKLTSRPTEKVQLKSIAFNKGFKLRPKLTDDKPSMKVDDSIVAKENSIGFVINKSSEADQRPITKSFMILKEEKADITPLKPSKPTQFSKLMLILMQIQQQCEVLKGKSSHIRNSYRELAILNDDINRRIDEVIKNKPRK